MMSVPDNLNRLRDSLPNKKDLIEEQAGNIMTQLRAANQILLNTCPTKPPVKGHFLNRKTSKEFQKLNNTTKSLKNIRRQTHQTGLPPIKRIWQFCNFHRKFCFFTKGFFYLLVDFTGFFDFPCVNWDAGLSEIGA